MAKKTNKKDTRRPRSAWQRFLRAAALTVDIVAVAALCLTAYAGMVSPLKHGGIWGVFPLAFPVCLLAVTLMAVAQLFWHRRGAVICFLGMLLCAGPILTYCPLNFVKHKVPEGAETFTFMTYNAHNFVPPGVAATATLPPGDNPQLDYILNLDADIVCLQEALPLVVKSGKVLSLQQIESLHKKYPYICVSTQDLAVLSKFPIEPIHLDANRKNFPGGQVRCYRVSLPSGRLVTLFDVHLHSMQLKDNDLQTYKNLTELKGEDIGSLKSHILSKISAAAVGRARQVQQLLRYIRLYGGPDAIISGDFNDVPGCYAIRTLEDVGFRSVYPDCGLGPMITSNNDRLYFCIDHTLYRGALRPVSMKKGHTKASDHYPLTTTFYIEGK